MFYFRLIRMYTRHSDPWYESVGPVHTVPSLVRNFNAFLEKGPLKIVFVGGGITDVSFGFVKRLNVRRLSNRVLRTEKCRTPCRRPAGVTGTRPLPYGHGPLTGGGDGGGVSGARALTFPSPPPPPSRGIDRTSERARATRRARLLYKDAVDAPTDRLEMRQVPATRRDPSLQHRAITGHRHSNRHGRR